MLQSIKDFFKATYIKLLGYNTFTRVAVFLVLFSLWFVLCFVVISTFGFVLFNNIFSTVIEHQLWRLNYDYWLAMTAGWIVRRFLLHSEWVFSLLPDAPFFVQYYYIGYYFLINDPKLAVYLIFCAWWMVISFQYLGIILRCLIQGDRNPCIKLRLWVTALSTVVTLAIFVVIVTSPGGPAAHQLLWLLGFFVFVACVV